MRSNRIDELMDVEFETNGHRESTSVWIPFEIFMSALREYFDRRLVTVDGTDSAVWNAMLGCGALDALLDSDEVIGICRDKYKGTSYEEEDYADWLESIDD